MASQEEEKRGVPMTYQEGVWWSEQRKAREKLPITNLPNIPAIVFRHLTGNEMTFAGADMWAPRGILLWQMPKEGQTQFYYCAHIKRQAVTASTAQRIGKSRGRKRTNATDKTKGSASSGSTPSGSAYSSRTAPTPDSQLDPVVRRGRRG